MHELPGKRIELKSSLERLLNDEPRDNALNAHNVGQRNKARGRH